MASPSSSSIPPPPLSSSSAVSPLLESTLQEEEEEDPLAKEDSPPLLQSGKDSFVAAVLDFRIFPEIPLCTTVRGRRAFSPILHFPFFHKKAGRVVAKRASFFFLCLFVSWMHEKSPPISLQNLAGPKLSPPPPPLLHQADTLLLSFLSLTLIFSKHSRPFSTSCTKAPFMDLGTDNVIISLPSPLLVWVCRLQFSRSLRGTAEVWKKEYFYGILHTRISRNIPACAPAPLPALCSLWRRR